MRVTSSGGTALGTAFPARRSVYQNADEIPATKRVALRPEPAALVLDASWQARPRADILAQLIARAADMPVSRVRRRADPAEAAASYRAAADLPRAKARKSLCVI